MLVGEANDRRVRCATCHRPIKGQPHEHKGLFYGSICYDRILAADMKAQDKGAQQEEFQIGEG